MGDNRYYTYDQFFNIIILTILTIVTLFSTVVYYYQNKDDKQNAGIFLAFITLAITFVLRFIELVIPIESTAMYLRIISTYFLINSIVMILVYLDNRKVKIVIPFAYLVTSILIIVTSYYPRLLLRMYHFGYIRYSYLYHLLLVTLLVVCLFRIFDQRQHKLKTIGLIIMFLSIIILMLDTKHQLLRGYLTFLSSGLLLVSTNILIYSNNKYGITILAFNKVADMLNDYILIVNNENKVIFRNERIIKSSIFKHTEIFDSKKMNNLFNGNLIQKNDQHNQPVLKIKIDDTLYYFSLAIKSVNQGSDFESTIYTFIDISDLMKLVYDLEESNKASHEVNKELHKYKNVVYRLEKENKINALLDEINKKHKNALDKLYEQISNLDVKDKEIDIKLDTMITYNNLILKDIRQAVSAYQEHYGG